MHFLVSAAAVAFTFLLRNVSSNQWGINQSHLILSEGLWKYLETTLSAAWGEARSRCNPWIQNCAKQTNIYRMWEICFSDFIILSCSTHFIWNLTPSVLSPVIYKKKKQPFGFSFGSFVWHKKSTIYFLLNPSTVIQTLEVYHLMYEMTSVWVMRCNMCKQIKDIMDAKE